VLKLEQECADIAEESTPEAGARMQRLQLPEGAIIQWSDQAYWRAIGAANVHEAFGEAEEAQLWRAVAIALRRQGYHLNPKKIASSDESVGH